MTDNEIIKLLECCKKSQCSNCEYGKQCDGYTQVCYALDLINRQQAEIADERAKDNICAEVIARQDKEIAKYKAEIKNYSRNNRSLTAAVTEMQAALKKQSAEIERLKNDCFCIANERDAIGDCINTAVDEAKAEAIEGFADKVTYCKDCAKYELMTSNNQYFCNQFGGYVTETDCCSRGVPCKRNGG